MQQPSRSSAVDSGTVEGPAPQLTDAQRTFAEVVGRELARLWIHEQAATVPRTLKEAPERTPSVLP